MSKSWSKKTKGSNLHVDDVICGGCKQKVKISDGVQCQGPCSKWRHFRCMDVSACKLRAIRAGEIEIRCPCPDCEPRDESLWRAPCRRGVSCSQSEVSSQTADSTGNYTDLHDTTAMSEPSPITRADVHADNANPTDCDAPCDPKEPLAKADVQPQRITSAFQNNNQSGPRAGDVVFKRKESQSTALRLAKAVMPSVVNAEAKGSCPADCGPRRGDTHFKRSEIDTSFQTTAMQVRETYEECAESSNVGLRSDDGKLKRTEVLDNGNAVDSLRQSTERLHKSLTKMTSGFEDLKSKQDAVELCFQSVRQMCEAVDQLAEKINEVVERVKETVEETERERSRAVSRKASKDSEGRMCFCPSNPTP